MTRAAADGARRAKILLRMLSIFGRVRTDGAGRRGAIQGDLSAPATEASLRRERRLET